MPSELVTDRENLRFALRRLVDSLGREQWREFEVRILQELCTHYRRLAICELLLEADMEAFRANLYHSGRAHLALLHRIDRGVLRSHYHLCTSRAWPFLDSVAADDLDTARAMVPLCASSWLKGDEYEEDFLYMRCLMDALVHGATSQQALVHLQRLREVATESDMARLQLCEALLAMDAQAFNAALLELIRQRQERIAEERKNTAADPGYLRTEAQICIEGIGLMKLARHQGMEVLAQAPGIPRWTFTPTEGRLPAPDAWRHP